MRKTLSALVLVTAVGFAALTGCASSASTEASTTPTESTSAATAEETPAETTASDESALEACAQLADLQTESSDLMDVVSSGDMSKATEALASMEEKLRELAGEITNPEVKAAVTQMADAYTSLSEALEKAQSGDASGLTDVTTELQDAASALTTACTS
ncbi:MAG: hypothetical protein QM611_07615 [Microbacterium sp.]|uniref:hypothetical protein n=1 Tax=Microbacterium sp. TaxID=51671 RepID=UPI0039E5D346